MKTVEQIQAQIELWSNRVEALKGDLVRAQTAEAAKLAANAEKPWSIAERDAARALASNNTGLMRQRMAELRELQNETLKGASQVGTPEEKRRWNKVMQWDRTHRALLNRAEFFERRRIDQQVDLEVHRGDCAEDKAAARRSDLWDKHMEALNYV